MSITRIGAHPLVVAVALGLLGPAALEREADEPHEAAVDPSEAVKLGEHEVAVREIPEDELHRVELAWLEARARTTG